MSESVSIYDQICKYLELLDNRDNLSRHTLRAYGSDLMEVFQIKGHGKLSGPKIDGSINYRIHWNKFNLQGVKKSPDEWKELLRSQIRTWGSLSPRTRRRKQSSLNAFLNWMAREAGIHIDLHLMNGYKKVEKLPHFLSVDECLSLCKFLLKPQDLEPAQKQQGLLFFLMYGAGLRLSEACSLKWSSFSRDSKSLKILGKGGKERLVTLPYLVTDVVHKWGDLQGPYIWGERELPTRTAYQRIKDLGKDCGLFKPLHPHALRHSYATQLLTSGSDLRVLQKLLGHQSLSATEIYTHLDIDQLAHSMEKYHPLSKGEA